MCSILTVTTDEMAVNLRQYLTYIRSEARMNSHGFAALLLADEPRQDAMLRTMDLHELVTWIGVKTSVPGRLFIHLRYATTNHVGLAGTHGFDTRRGQFVMHNGVITANATDLLDSHRIADYDSAWEAFADLQQDGERYANVFWIDTLTRSYSVFRLFTGSLYSDGFGNYATNPVADITHEVDTLFFEDHYADDYMIDEYAGDFDNWRFVK